MKITCKQQDLSRGLSAVSHAVSSRSTLPILANILVATDHGRLKLSATNLEIGINCWVDAQVHEEGTTTVPAKLLVDLPSKLRLRQEAFDRTGGLHAAGLFKKNGQPIVVREDVGRHNAVDKVIGWALLNDRLPLSDVALIVSGRGGFEIVQKALVAGVPLLASVSAPSSLAVQLAREFGMALVGFLRGQRFVIYSGQQRIRGEGTGDRGQERENRE